MLVGLSWEGSIAAALLAEGTWRGPTVLLCPALAVREQWVGAYPEGPAEFGCAAITAQLAALDDDIKRQCVIVHGTEDETVPLEDSHALSAATNTRLEEVEGGSQGLGPFTAEDGIWKAVQGVLRAPKKQACPAD